MPFRWLANSQVRILDFSEIRRIRVPEPVFKTLFVKRVGWKLRKKSDGSSRVRLTIREMKEVAFEVRCVYYLRVCAASARAERKRRRDVSRRKRNARRKTRRARRLASRKARQVGNILAAAYAWKSKLVPSSGTENSVLVDTRDYVTPTPSRLQVVGRRTVQSALSAYSELYFNTSLFYLLGVYEKLVKSAELLKHSALDPYDRTLSVSASIARDNVPPISQFGRVLTDSKIDFLNLSPDLCTFARVFIGLFQQTGFLAFWDCYNHCVSQSRVFSDDGALEAHLMKRVFMHRRSDQSNPLERYALELRFKRMHSYHFY